jgi:hypothetical protein
MRALLLLALPPLFAQGPIAVYTVSAGGVETVVANLIELGTVSAGDLLDTRFRLRNIGSSTVTLNSLRISGTAFSLQGNPTGPQGMTPNYNIDFRVRFQPLAFGVYSALLLVNDRTIVVRGTAPGGVTFGVDRGAGFERVSNERPVDFGRVEVGALTTLRFLLRNDSSSNSTVSRIGLAGGFEGPLDIRFPLDIEPGGIAAFGVRFAPDRVGVFRGTLDLDGRVYQIEGLGADAPLPSADLLFGNAGSGQQAALKILFKSPPRNRGTVLLRLTFLPLAGSQDDPGVMLMPAAQRQSTLTIQAGELSRDVTIQTGTTAGRIQLRLEESGRLLGETSIDIPPSPVRLSSVQAFRQAGSIEIRISGFDNARTVSEAAFTFYDKAGQAISTEPVRSKVGEVFTAYFRESALGGLFQLRAFFPVSGDASALGSVQVEMVNSSGSARSERVSF